MNDERKARAMGYLEGLLTHDRIYDAYVNIIHSSNPLPPHVVALELQQVRSVDLQRGNSS